MASNPVTPPSKQNGNGLQDPFTDEKQGDHRKSGEDEKEGDHRNSGGDEEEGNHRNSGGDEKEGNHRNFDGNEKENRKGNGDQLPDGEDSKKEMPSLFYAYARRSDNHWSSRYLLTFSSAQVCNDWWYLVETEYPNQGTRHGPQFFSFVGDDFPKKPATNPKFEHLKTKWFYSQFGDASTTGGRTQEIIPLQDWDGRIIRGGEGDEAPHKAVHQNDDKGKGKAIENDEVEDDEDEKSDKRQRKGESDHFDFSGLASSLASAASIADTNNAQVSQLAESQYRDQEAIQQQQERMQRVEALVEENAAQLQALAKSHIRAQQQNRELAEQNARILRELKRQRAQTQTLVEALAGKEGPGRAEGREKEQGEIEGLHVVVHPPPRKIDRVMVGYAYQLGEDGDAAKSSPAKRPALGRKSTSAVAGTKGVSGK